MRIEQLTFTRFIAAISIVIFHFGMNSFLFKNDFVSFLFSKANLAVSYFFILSGFVMIIAYRNRTQIKFRTYFKNRFARIYPVYFLAIILILISKLFQNIRLDELFLNLTMLQSWFPGKSLSLNYPGWSLSVEVFFYLTFPLSFKYLIRNRLVKTSIIIIAFWTLSQVFYHLIINGIINISIYTIDDINYNPLFHLNEFLIGNLTGLYYLESMKRKKSTKHNYILILILLILLGLFLKHQSGVSYHNGILAIIFAPLIFLIAKSKGWVSTFFSNRIFVFLGEISFGIYIYQVPIWIISGFILTDYRMDKYLGIAKNYSDNTTTFLIKLFVLILISAISYIFIENPLREKIKKISTTSVNSKYRALK